MFKNDLIFILPEFFLIACIIFLLICSVFFSNKKTAVGYFIIHKTLISNCYFLLLVYLALVLQTPEGGFGALGNFVIIDNSVIFFKVVLIILSLIFFIILKDYTANLKYFDFEFIIITLFSIAGMLLLLHSNDMVSFYITIELQSLCFYVLVSSKQTSSFSTESGLKYFILGSFSSCLLLFGLILIYGFSGMFNFAELQLYSHFLTGGFTYNGMLTGIFLVTVSLLFKIGLVPFHM
jgi:NADH-quinone oxidoreductase subunit N